MVNVSVIIPVYNTVSYVEDAIRSVLDQTLTDIEIIIINDGSTDLSPTVLNRLASEDNRIRLFSQKNSGPALARNLGISHSTGRYLYFMDSDDILLPETLEECSRKCDQEQLDFVFFDADILHSLPGFSIGYDYKRCGKLQEGVYKGLRVMDMLLTVEGFRVPPWLHLIRREFLEKNSIRFEDILREDELFTHLLFIKAERVSFIDKAYFRRRIRPNSFVTSPFTSQHFCAYLYIMNVILALKEGDALNDNEKTIIDRAVKRMMAGDIYRSRSLSLAFRIKVFYIVLTRYMRFTDLHSLFSLWKPIEN